MVLPSQSFEIDTDEEVGEDGKTEDIDDGDFLADFPDHTEVQIHSLFCLKIRAVIVLILFLLLRN